MTEHAIATEGLAKHFSSARALDGLSMRVPRGSIYGFLGRNGAGKTTTLRILMGLVRPTSGRAWVLGMNWPQDGPEILQRTAYVGERKLLLDSMTGRELVRFNRSFFPRWSDELATRYARQLEIPMEQPFHKLSLGNRTKLCLLLALAQGADALVLDEPTAGLDPVAMDELLKCLIADHAVEGRTIFLSSHNLGEVEKIADWVGIIDHGRLLLEAPLEDIRTDYRRVSAAGNELPSGRTSQVASAIAAGSSCEYIITRDADQFLATLRNQGATILDVSPLNLQQVFLQLVPKEEPCTSGSAGTTPAVASSSASAQ